jgi:hypothetical protein
MKKKYNRRTFIKLMLVSSGVSMTSCIPPLPEEISNSVEVTPTPHNYLPVVNNGLPFTSTPTKTPTNTPTRTPTKTSTTTQMPSNIIIADHRVVADYNKIPQSYISQVKKMWADIVGESHSFGYRLGCYLLQEQDSRFKVNITEGGVPEGYTDQYLRISRGTWGDIDNATGWIYFYGEEDWFTSTLAVERTKNHITYCNTHNLAIAAIGFAWCWDMTSDWIYGGVDPVYKVRWGGSSGNGPDGDLPWGLDSGDYSLTGNHVCMDTYINATEQLKSHCEANNYPTKVLFTTGPVDSSWNLDESGYQRHIKHEYIRNFVKNNSRILFDYADILCWNDSDQQNLVSWVDAGGTNQIFPVIHPENMLDLNGGYVEDGDHIGQRGAIRLAKALWWLLARIAGWVG